MGRLFQDFSFVVSVVTDRPLLRLSGSVDPEDPNDTPIVVYALLDTPLEWHRFFLDAGAGFWETCSAETVAEEHDDDSIRIVDYFCEILPQSIRRAYAIEPSPVLATRIIIELYNGHAVQLICDGDIPDSPARISLKRSPQSES